MASTPKREPLLAVSASVRVWGPKVQRLSDRYLWWFGCAISGALLVANLVASHYNRQYNSDDVALQTVLSQWARGYHHVATVGSDTFILKAPLYLLLGQLTHNGRSVLLLTGLILNVAGFSLFVLPGCDRSVG